MSDCCSKPARWPGISAARVPERCEPEHPSRRGVGLTGPNGAGRTTFFNCTDRATFPDGGGFVFDGAAAGRRAAQGRDARHCPTFQEHPPVRQHVGAGKRDGQPARAHADGHWRHLPRPGDRCRGGCDPPACPRTALRGVEIGPTTWRRICPTATSGVSRLPARSPPAQAALSRRAGLPQTDRNRELRVLIEGIRKGRRHRAAHRARRRW